MSDARVHFEPRAEPPTATVIIRDGIVDDDVVDQWEEWFVDVAGPSKEPTVRKIMKAARLGLRHERRDMKLNLAEIARLLRQMADQVAE